MAGEAGPQHVQVLRRRDQQASGPGRQQQRLAVGVPAPFGRRPQRGADPAAAAVLGPHAVLVQRHDEGDASRQEEGQQADRAGGAEDRRRELHVHQVEVKAAQCPGGRGDAPDVPPLSDADGTLPGGPRPLVRCDDERFEPGGAQVDGEPARVVGHPVPRRVQVAADQPDPRPAHSRCGLLSLDNRRSTPEARAPDAEAPTQTGQAVAMPTLVVVRHAKADRPAGVDDFDRHLLPRGRTDARGPAPG